MTLRARVHHLLDGPERTRAATIVRLSLAALIVLNVTAVVLETVAAIEQHAGRLFGWFEQLSLAVFAFEYLLRLWCAPEQARFAQGFTGRLRWMLTPAALVDLLAIAPALLPGSGADLRALRLLRLVRMLRILKLGRYSIALSTLQRVLRQKMPDLMALAFVLFVLLVLSATAMYYLENDAQPQAFSSIPAAMWWGIVTLTTIGYGDMAPVTDFGRLLGGVVAVLGIGMFALPAGLLGAAFVDELSKLRTAGGGGMAADKPEQERCPHCDHVIER